MPAALQDDRSLEQGSAQKGRVDDTGEIDLVAGHPHPVLVRVYRTQVCRVDDEQFELACIRDGHVQDVRGPNEIQQPRIFLRNSGHAPGRGKRDRDKVPVVGRPVVAQGRKHGSGLQGVVADLQQVDGHIRGDTFRLVRDDRHTPVPLRFGEIHGHEPLVGVELHRVV